MADDQMIPPDGGPADDERRSFEPWLESYGPAHPVFADGWPTERAGPEDLHPRCVIAGPCRRGTVGAKSTIAA
jgi:hypothetical protein